MTLKIFERSRQRIAPEGAPAGRPATADRQASTGLSPRAATRLSGSPDARRRTGLRRLADTRGNNLIEAAIITPLMVFMTFSIIDFATILYAYLSLENGVSQATRFAVTGNLLDDPNTPGAKLSRKDSIITAMRNATPTLTIPDDAFTFSHLPPGATTWVNGVGGPNAIEKVSVEYSWSLLSPVLRPFLADGQIRLVVDSAMKNEGRFE
jgi:Flp pilus assembly protein TadG